MMKSVHTFRRQMPSCAVEGQSISSYKWMWVAQTIHTPE